MKFLPVILASTLLFSCTPNQRVKALGGSMNVDIPQGNKFVVATWKTQDNSSSLWYTYRPMRADETPETWTMQEQSNFGVWEGTVTFTEHR